MSIRNVGVIGCGQMGGGIAQVCAKADYPVIVSEPTTALLRQGLEKLTSNLDLSITRNKLTSNERDSILSRINGTTNFLDFSDCDIVIEAVREDLTLKKDIFRELDSICKDTAILATNTSCLPVMDIVTGVSNKARVLGIHFFNPAPAMGLVEIITTAETSEDAKEASLNFIQSLNKTAIVVRDTPGFIVNRLVSPQILAAIRLLEDGIASAGDIDISMKLGMNHPMGPLALADLIGLDTVLGIADGIYERLGKSQYAAPRLLREMVANGNLGRKTGKGFYTYNS